MRGISPAAGAARAQAAGTALAVGAGLAGIGICAALALALASVPAVAATRSPAAPGARAATAVSGATSATSATSATVPVIVFLKNRPAAGGGARVRSDQRFAVVQAAQAPYLNRLAQLGAADVHRYALVDAIAARVPSCALRRPGSGG